MRAVTGGQLRHCAIALTEAPPRAGRAGRRARTSWSFPRGDLRRSSARLPSRWLLPSMRPPGRRPAVDATGWQAVPGLIGSPSYAASLARTEARHRAGVADPGRDRRAAPRRRRRDAVLPADEVVRRAVAMMRARAGKMLTRFDGDLSRQDLPDPASGRAVSPTALEAWARCPHAYFVARMLRVEPVESPEELVQISPLEIGTLVHTALDRFFDQQAAARTVPGRRHRVDSGSARAAAGHRHRGGRRIRRARRDRTSAAVAPGAAPHPRRPRPVPR